jgi:hypothetical protein
MIRPDEMLDALERQLATRLQPPRLPPVDEAWAGVQSRLLSRGARRRPRRLVVWVALAAAALLVLTTGLALAASPELRDYAADVLSGRATLVGGKITSSGLESLYPAPRFAVLQPSGLPAGWGFVGYGYRPGPVDVGPLNLARPDGVNVFSRIAGRDIPREVVDEAGNRARRLLAGSPGPLLVLLYDQDAGQLVELGERPATDGPLAAGQATSVHGLPAVFTRRQDREVLAWVEQGTRLELSATTGRAEMLRLAEAVRATPLIPFEQTAAGRALANPPTPPTTVPLSRRVGEREAPRASRQAIVQQCGWHPDLAARPPEVARDQVLCAARLASGVPQDHGSWGFDVSAWHRAAERLGLDAAAGPAGDPPVYLVQIFDTGEGEGRAVVLDAATGEPYLVVQLKPAP